MERFTIGPMCVTKDDFKKELEKNGLKYGYIASLYEKFKQDDMTVFRILIGGIPYTVVTDNESNYPEIQEETGKKIEIEPYSLEWLENLIYDSNIIGPSFYESLLRHLQTYYNVKKAEQRDKTKEQKNCQYCHGKAELDAGFHANASIGKDESGKTAICIETLEQTFFIQIKVCPMCGRKLEAL